MDRMYRYQRHVYDTTRKFYLLGRDELVAGLRVPENGTVLEIGCGTGRNLVKIAERYPFSVCCGLDVSNEMLTTARRAVARARCTARIRLAQADATNFDPGALFEYAVFDRVIISYALSIIPPWRDVLRRSVDVVAPGGELHIVDFGDQAGLPHSFKTALELWLRQFHVTPRSGLVHEAQVVANQTNLQLSSRALYRGYATTLKLTRSAAA